MNPITPAPTTPATPATKAPAANSSKTRRAIPEEATAADIVAEPITAPIPTEAPAADISAEEGLRYYTAILGHEPTLDPEAPDVLSGHGEADGSLRAWAEDLVSLRQEFSRRLHLKLKRRPSWRELMDAMTVAAARRIDEARKRLSKRDAA